MLPQHLADKADEMLAGKAPQSVKPRRGEEIFTGEAADYPRSLADFIGQAAATEELAIKIASATARNARLEHTLFQAGEGGIGKTTLAHLVAHLMGVGLIPTTGKGLNVDEFRTMVMSCEDRDIIFVDEFHMLFEGGRNRGDWLLPWMLGGGLKTGRGVEKTPDVTLVVATTDAGKAPETLLSRFVNTPELELYTAEEGALLTGNLSRRMGVPLEPGYWPDVSRAADRNPRAIRKILYQIRDLAHARPETHPNLPAALKYAGRSEDGLTTLARNMLIVLAAKQKHTCSAETLAGELGEPGSLRSHEQALQRRGFLEISGQGRTLTREGLRRAYAAFEEVAR
jgi:Holliday junction DNA helicase RuvB